MPTTVMDALSEIVGENYLFQSSDDLAIYGRDRTEFLAPNPMALVKPQTTEQVRKIVLLANQRNIKLVPSGGRTGLSGGAVAAANEVIVSFDKMNKLLELNLLDQTLSCEAGMITAMVQTMAADNHLCFPIDFASSGSSQIGGNVATNAGGIKVIKYGMIRQWVLGLTVVTGAGEILKLKRGLIKDNSGYDLTQLFIGSEGTLGFITEVILKLESKPKESSVMVLGLSNLSDAVEVLVILRNKLSLTAFEFFSENALAIVIDRQGITRPFPDSDAESEPFYLLVEFDNEGGVNDSMAQLVFEECLQRELTSNGVISQSLQQKKDLWRLREDISESISRDSPYKNDISVRPSRVAEFVLAIEAIVETNYPNFTTIWFGHIGDGNIHLNILKPDNLSKQEFDRQCAVVSRLVFETVEKFEGSISAEHGVGLLKKEGLGYCRSNAEIALMRGIKTVFDPNGVMNPGKIFN